LSLKDCIESKGGGKNRGPPDVTKKRGTKSSRLEEGKLGFLEPDEEVSARKNLPQKKVADNGLLYVPVGEKSVEKNDAANARLSANQMGPDSTTRDGPHQMGTRQDSAGQKKTKQGGGEKTRPRRQVCGQTTANGGVALGQEKKLFGEAVTGERHKRDVGKYHGRC